MSLKDKIRDGRIAAQMTQGEASAKMGWGRTVWANYECGRRRPSPETLARMAAAVGANLLEWLADRE
ncbi:MAG: helix-turn-helix transcriptional regulator [Rhodopirellula sp.]|nr:helix-turn-helix transcriptional regulator [Rhodopirellula sp.]